MRTLALVTAAVLASPILLAGCTNSEAEEAQACNYNETVDNVTVSGEQGETPTITVDGPPTTVEELIVKDLCQGDGEVLASDSDITADYVGVALSNGQVFDSSYERGEPLEFALDGVIPGWQQGLTGAQVGDTKLLIIPGSLAYGPVSPGPGIGADETLVFVVDVLPPTDSQSQE